MAGNFVSYPVATGVTIVKGDAVAISSGALILADSTDLGIGFAYDGGTEDEYVSVVTEGTFYARATDEIAAGARVQASDAADGTVKTAGALTGRMLGIALADAVGGLVKVAVGPFDVNVDT